MAEQTTQNATIRCHETLRQAFAREYRCASHFPRMSPWRCVGTDTAIAARAGAAVGPFTNNDREFDWHAATRPREPGTADLNCRAHRVFVFRRDLALRCDNPDQHAGRQR